MVYNSLMEKNIITQYFEEVETTKEYHGHFCSVADAITIVILESICGLKNISQIHQWAASDRIREFLKEIFAIETVPCYYWLLCLLKLVKPESLNRYFVQWAAAMIPEYREGLTLALDGKTIRSAGKMDSYESPLHIVSAQVSEPGITFAQKSIEGKSNEVPAVQELLEEMEISGCMIVTDALNCQKKTAAAVIVGGADYLLCAKDDQKNLQKNMDREIKIEKNRNRIEKCTAFVTGDIDWMPDKVKKIKFRNALPYHLHLLLTLLTLPRDISFLLLNMGKSYIFDCTNTLLQYMPVPYICLLLLKNFISLILSKYKHNIESSSSPYLMPSKSPNHYILYHLYYMYILP